MQDFKRNFLFWYILQNHLFSFYIINYESIKLFKWVCRKIWNLYFDEFVFWARDTWHTENLWLKENFISLIDSYCFMFDSVTRKIFHYLHASVWLILVFFKLWQATVWLIMEKSYTFEIKASLLKLHPTFVLQIMLTLIILYCMIKIIKKAWSCCIM